MLLFAAVVGTICFIYGFLTYDDNEWRCVACFVALLDVTVLMDIVHSTHVFPVFKKNFPAVKKSVVRKSEAALSCARCVTRNVATGNSTQHVTHQG